MSMQRPITLALDGGGVLRAGRWVGRALTALASWPLWYSVRARITRGGDVDWDALLFGVPAIIVGLALWWWCGYRLRNPQTGLVIDHAGQELRLLRRGVVYARAEFTQIAAWGYRTWETVGSHDGVRRTTTWHAARNLALGEEDLFVAFDRESCEAWVERAEQALRAPTELELDEPWARSLDRRLDRAKGLPVLIFLILAAGVWMAAAVLVLADRTSELAETVPSLAVLAAVLAVAWCISGRRVVGSAWAVGMGVALAAKLWLVPMTWSFMDEVDRVSPTSETGLNYLLSGLALIVVGILVAVLRAPRPGEFPPARTALVGATTRQEVIKTKLPPPKAGE